jgi:threonine dehydratase
VDRRDVLEATNAARTFLEGRIHRTPLEESEALSRRLGVPVYLKLEQLQLTGSFKLRGALLRLKNLSGPERERGVATCSAGNHGWALAHAGRRLGIPVTVYVPGTVDPSKKAGIESLAATVIQTDFPGFDETEEFALHEADRLRLSYVSAFNDLDIIIGNGATIAAEILEDLPAAETFVTPVGGGGLAAGLCLYLAAQRPPFSLVAAQLAACPALRLSLERGSAVTRMPPVETLAGGLEGGIGSRTFEIIRDHINDLVLISEAELLAAVRWFFEISHHVVEPSGAASLAACLKAPAQAWNGPIVVVLTGRNLAAERLRRILAS